MKRFQILFGASKEVSNTCVMNIHQNITVYLGVKGRHVLQNWQTVFAALLNDIVITYKDTRVLHSKQHTEL